MENINFTISHNGRFVFRTELMAPDRASAAQSHLVAKFPASEGYRISRHEHPATFTSTDITGAH